MKRYCLFFICFFLFVVCGFAQQNVSPIYPDMAVEFGDIHPPEKMYVATNMDKIFVHYELDSNSNLTAVTIGDRNSSTAVGPNSVSIGSNNSATAQGGVAIGNNSTVSGTNSIAAGQNAVASNNNTFVWSATDETYGSRDDGTFNVNPVNGIEGVFIGNTNLKEHITSLIPPVNNPFIMYYNTSFEEWPHEIETELYLEQSYELDEESQYASEPFVLKLPTNSTLTYTKLTVFIHQSPQRYFYYDIASDNIDDTFPSQKTWLEETEKDSIWKFEFESFPSCGDWSLVRYTKREIDTYFDEGESRFWFHDKSIVTTNIVGEMPTTYKTNIYLTNIRLGTNVTSIANSAFSGCTGLMQAILSENIQVVGKQVFSTCYNLLSIYLPDSVTSLGYRTFSSCRNLTTVSIGPNITTIKNEPFYGCRSLNLVEFRGLTKSEVRSFTNYPTLAIPEGCTIRCTGSEPPEEFPYP